MIVFVKLYEFLIIVYRLRYFVFTTKHHDGFTNWPSTYSFGWNSMDIGPNKNIIQQIKTALEENSPDIHFGLYYSLMEWFHPLFLQDQQKTTNTRYVNIKSNVRINCV